MTEGPGGNSIAAEVPAPHESLAESRSQTRDPAARLEFAFGCALLAVIVGHSASAYPFVANVKLHWFGWSMPLGALLANLDVGIEIALVALAFRWYLPFARGVRTRGEPIETFRWWWRVGLAIFPAYWAAIAVVISVSSQRALRGTEVWLAHLSGIQGYVPDRWNRGLDGLRGGELIGVFVVIAVGIPAFAASARLVARYRDAFTVQVIGAACVASAGVVLVGISGAHQLWAPFRVVAPYLTAIAIGIGIAAVCDDVRSASSHDGAGNSKHRLGNGIVVVALAVLLAGMAVAVSRTTGNTRDVVVEVLVRALVAALFVAGVVVAPIGFGRKGGARHATVRRVTAAVRSIGTVAFGAYLWHWLVIETIRNRVASPSWFGFGFITIVSVVVAVVCGAASQFFVEKPVDRYFAHRESRGSARLVSVGQRIVGVRVERRFVRGLAAITAMSFIWRVTYVVTHVGRVKLAGDAFYYHWQANDLARGRWFVDPVQLRFYGRITPSAFHPPAYVSYLAAVSRFIGESELTHRLASTVLGAATVFAVGFCARQLFGCDAAGWLAAAFAGVYAHLWINDEMLMSESMAQLWTIAMLLAVFRFWRNPRAGTAALMGAAIACSALSRAEASTLFVLLVVPLALGARALVVKRRVALVVVKSRACWHSPT